MRHGKAGVLTPARFARLLALLEAGDCTDVQLVDHNGKVRDCPRLKKDAEELEQRVRRVVGGDNVRAEPPPAKGSKPKKPPKDDKDKPKS